MSDIASNEQAEPAQAEDEINFPPLPEINDDDFDDEVTEEEKKYFKTKYPDLRKVVYERIHCTACDRHLGSSGKNESRMKQHPLLRTLVCQTCHSFYNSGEFEKGDDGSELYCRWCGQGGQVYCCSDCPHVFCAKCIKRNFGVTKIKEIENTDDWICFKCNPQCLRDLRALCWALLKYCDLKNRVIHHTEDRELREKYEKATALDVSTCCKHKVKRREKTDSAKKKKEENKEQDAETVAKKILCKIPPAIQIGQKIQVKKFASINIEDLPKVEKKPVKRSASPKPKTVMMKNPISLVPVAGPGVKKLKIANSVVTPIRLDKTQATYSRIAPRPRIIQGTNIYNGFAPGIYPALQSSVSSQTLVPNDNINLSLDSLTQGLDFGSMNDPCNNDVVCTPDFPLEPLCEVTEEQDDDVQCMTPGPVKPILSKPPPLSRLSSNNLDNIVQMTENDVTVNAATGGLKFRVDPQTLSSNKMYRLPDGRVFAINVNPKMPGGYSATIVSVSDTTGKSAPRGETFSAKLRAVSNSSTPIDRKLSKIVPNLISKKPITPKKKDTGPKTCDMKVPVEWYRYNLIDAIDALEYSLSRLQKLRKEATTVHLRTRTVDEMKYLHKTLDQLLTTSSKRFIEIRENLNEEFKEYVRKKNQDTNSSDQEEDDDVLILPDEDQGPISIDENSMDSINCSEKQVDLTEVNSSEQNNSNEVRNNADNDLHENSNDPIQISMSQDDPAYQKNDQETSRVTKSILMKDNDDTDAESDKNDENINEETTEFHSNTEGNDNNATESVDNIKSITICQNKPDASEVADRKKPTDNADNMAKENDSNETKTNGLTEGMNTDSLKTKSQNVDESSDKSVSKTDLNCKEEMKDSEMNDEMIDSLLNDNNTENVENIPNLMDIAELDAR